FVLMSHGGEAVMVLNGFEVVTKSEQRAVVAVEYDGGTVLWTECAHVKDEDDSMSEDIQALYHDGYNKLRSQTNSSLEFYEVVLNYADVEIDNLDVLDRVYELTKVIWKPLFTYLINLRLSGDRTKNNRADGMLPDHIPMIAELKPGLLSFREGNDVKKYFIGSGVAFVCRIEFLKRQLEDQAKERQEWEVAAKQINIKIAYMLQEGSEGRLMTPQETRDAERLHIIALAEAEKKKKIMQKKFMSIPVASTLNLNREEHDVQGHGTLVCPFDKLIVVTVVGWSVRQDWLFEEEIGPFGQQEYGR
ncbi:ATP synthase subunit delta', mitochondrial-like protein, partial [Tanacetum coccineum]